MTEYQVTWTIELDADNPTEAAMQARMLLLDPESEAVHFEVAPFASRNNPYEVEHVDLSDVDFTTVDV